MKLYQKLVFIAMITIFWVVLTLYTTYGIQTLFPHQALLAIGYQRFCMALLVVTCTGVLFSPKHMREMSKRQMYLISAMMIIVVGQLVYSIFLVVGDILYSFWGIDAKLLNHIGLSLAEAFIIMSIYGSIWGKYRYKIVNKTIHFDDLPSVFDGVKIVQISDVHAGSFDNAKAVQAGIRMLKEQAADMFVFTGDLVNNSAGEFERWKHIFDGITAPLGQYSILGNHDYGDYIAWDSHDEKQQNLEALKKHHADVGRRLLLNEHIVLERGEHKLIIAGVENRGDGFSRHGDIDKALHGVDEESFVVLLSHDPTHWEKIVKDHDKHVHVTLSGHTHAMQMGFNFSWFKRSPIKYRYKKWAGHYTEKGKHLYINRGFGFLGLSARIGMRPEITVLELKRA